jgi:hypothetical protein
MKKSIKEEAQKIYRKVGYKTKTGYSPTPFSGESQKADNDYKRILKQVNKMRSK